MFIDILIKKIQQLRFPLIHLCGLFSLAIYCIYQGKKDNQFNICFKLVFPTLKH